MFGRRNIFWWKFRVGLGYTLDIFEEAVRPELLFRSGIVFGGEGKKILSFTRTEKFFKLWGAS